MKANERLGDYELMEILGRGSFGTVWEARHVTLDRLSAVKVLDRLLPDERRDERFLREARIAAGLNHPNIVRVLEIGTAELAHTQAHYLVYELIEGVTLDEWAQFSELNFRELAELTAKLALALQHAHEHGIVHRDLKPENILVDLSGEPRITDFGLARQVDDRVTEQNVTLGTVAYMSPEQALGKSGEADAKSDVFSLGVILFELLTKQLPFTGKTIPSYFAQVSGSEPTSPNTINPHIPQDLVTICLKCLSQQPADRYASARSLAEDLQRFADGRPILARPAGVVEKTVRWCKRQPLAATLVGLLVAIAIVGPMIAIQQSTMRQEVSVRARALRETTYITDLREAYRVWNDGYLRQARRFLDQAADGEDGKRLRDFSWHFLDDRLSESFQVVAQTDSRIYAATMTDDEKHLLTVGESDHISIWNPENAVLARQINLPYSEYFAVTILPDKTTILVGDKASGDSQLRFFDFQSGVQTRTINLPTVAYPENAATVQSILTSPDGNSFLVGTRYDEVRHFNSEVELLAEVYNRNAQDTIAYSPDGQYVVMGTNSVPSGSQGLLRIWNLRTDDIESKVPVPGKPIGMAWAPHGKLIAVVTDENNGVDLFKVPSLEKINTLRAPTDRITHAAFYRDGRSLALAGYDGAITVKAVEFDDDGYTQGFYYPHDAPVQSLTYLKGGRLMTASEDGSVVVSRPARVAAAGASVTARVVNEIAYSEAVMKFSRSMDRLFVGNDKGQLCDERGQILAQLNAGISAIAFPPDGNSIACGMLDGSIRILDANNYSLLKEITLDVGSPATGQVEVITFAADGKLVVSVADDNIVRFRSLPEGKVLLEDKLTNRSTDALIHDELGLVFVCGYYDQIVVYDLKEHRKIDQLNASSTWDLLLHPKQPVLLSAHNDGVVRIWNLGSNQPEGALRGHTDGVLSLALHRDGKTLVTGSRDGTVRLWDLDRKQAVGVAHRARPKWSARSLAFSADWKRLFALVWDNPKAANIVEIGSTQDTFEGYDVSPREMDRVSVRSEIVTKNGRDSLFVKKNTHRPWGLAGVWLPERCKGHEIRAHFNFDLKQGEAWVAIDHFFSKDGFHEGEPTTWLGRSPKYSPGDNLTASTDWVRITHGPWEQLADEEKNPYDAALVLEPGAEALIHSIRIEARELTR